MFLAILPLSARLTAMPWDKTGLEKLTGPRVCWLVKVVVHPLQIEVLISNGEMEFLTFNGLVPITLKVEEEALNTLLSHLNNEDFGLLSPYTINSLQ